jgi:hypothetical protein
MILKPIVNKQAATITPTNSVQGVAYESYVHSAPPSIN